MAVQYLVYFYGSTAFLYAVSTIFNHEYKDYPLPSRPSTDSHLKFLDIASNVMEEIAASFDTHSTVHPAAGVFVDVSSGPFILSVYLLISGSSQ